MKLPYMPARPASPPSSTIIHDIHGHGDSIYLLVCLPLQEVSPKEAQTSLPFTDAVPSANKNMCHRVKSTE